MNAADDLGPQGCVDGAMFCDPRLAIQGLRADFNAPVAFAGAVVTGVAGVFMAFVDDRQRGWREGLLKFCVNLLFKSHYFSPRPFYLLSFGLNSHVRVGKVM